jgi:hypothetical protein
MRGGAVTTTAPPCADGPPAPGHQGTDPIRAGRPGVIAEPTSAPYPAVVATADHAQRSGSGNTTSSTFSAHAGSGSDGVTLAWL